MGKTLKIKTFLAVSAAVFSVLSIGLFSSAPAQAFDAKATPTMINRTAIAMGKTTNADNIFYDKDTSNDNYVWQNYTNGCYSDITREEESYNPDTGTGGGQKWVLRASTKLGDGSCSPEKTSTISEPKNYDEREWVVFYRGTDDVINSVKADVDNPFVKTPVARGGASAIYIEKDDMNPYDCPSLIIDQKSPDGWMYVMMRRADNDSDASNQYAALIRELASQNFFSESIQDGDFTSDNAICEVVPADGDDEKEDILEYYGLPGGYYNTRANDANREQVDLDYDGANLGGFDLHSMQGADAAGMALNGPLKGGFVADGQLDGGGQDDGGGDAEPVCSAGALGWIFCPLTDFMADAVEGIAGFLEGQLAFEALTNSEQGNAIKAMWGIILGVANAGLTVAFLMLIFSQATSVGISSYGVKKLLPRVVAAAVLMNLSFYICAAAVDIANILGVSIKSITDVGMDAVARNATGNAQSGASFGQYTVTIIAAILAAAIAIGTGAYALLFPVLLAGLLAILTAFLVIAAREVIITILIVLAPLAFLAWVLPNTEGWFTKWRKLFTAMLLMFPLVMAVFYGSLLVSSLISATSTNGTGVGGNINDFMVSLLAFTVLVVPLFSLPFIMKSAGGVLDRLGVIVNNRNKGVLDRSRKKAEEWKANSTYQRGRAVRKQIATDHKSTRFAKRVNRGGIAGIAAGGVGGNIGKIPALRNSVYGAQNTRMDEVATAAEAEAFEKRVAARMKYHTIKDTGFDGLSSEFTKALATGDQEQAVAAVRQLGTMGSSGRAKIDELMRGSNGQGVQIGDEEMRTKVNNALTKDMYGSLVGSRGDVAKGSFEGSQWKSGSMSSLGYEQLATQDSKTLRANNTQISPEAAHYILSDSNLKSRIQDAEARAVFEERAALHTPTPPPTGGPTPPPAPPSGGPTPPPAGGGGTP